MRVDLRTAIRSFLAWWGRELTAALPRPLRRLIRPVPLRLDVQICPEGLHAVLVDDTGTQRGAAADFDLQRAMPRRLHRRLQRMVRKATEVVLRLPPDKVLQPAVRLPLAAAERLDDVMAQEMDRHTPFHAFEVFYDWRIRGSDLDLEQIFVDLIVARQADVHAAVDLAASAGISVDAVRGPGDAAEQNGLNLVADEGSEKPRHRSATRILRPLALGSGLAAASWLALWFDGREAELTALQEELNGLRVRAAEVASLRDQATALAEARFILDSKKQQQPPVLAVLAAVTEAMPDGDWLLSYSHQGDSLRIEGHTGDASRLLARLEASELLAQVSFAAPVRRDQALGTDQFSIVAAVERQGAVR